jgi:hypothetical protein
MSTSTDERNLGQIDWTGSIHALWNDLNGPELRHLSTRVEQGCFYISVLTTDGIQHNQSINLLSMEISPHAPVVALLEYIIEDIRKLQEDDNHE